MEDVNKQLYIESVIWCDTKCTCLGFISRALCSVRRF